MESHVEYLPTPPNHVPKQWISIHLSEKQTVRELRDQLTHIVERGFGEENVGDWWMQLFGHDLRLPLSKPLEESQ